MCEIICDLQHSKIHIDYQRHYGIPNRHSTIDMSKATTLQRTDATWQIALAIKNSGIPTVKVTFNVGTGRQRKHYWRIIQTSKKKIMTDSSNIIITPIYGNNDTFNSVQRERILCWEITENVSYYTYDKSCIDTLSAIIFDKFNFNHGKNQSYVHFILDGLNSNPCIGCLDIFMTQNIINTNLWGVFVTIKSVNGSPITVTYPHTTRNVLITPFGVYYKYENKSIDCPNWTVRDICNVIPCIGLLYSIRDRLRLNLVSNDENFNVENCKKIFNTVYGIENE